MITLNNILSYDPAITATALIEQAVETGMVQALVLYNDYRPQDPGKEALLIISREVNDENFVHVSLIPLDKKHLPLEELRVHTQYWCYHIGSSSFPQHLIDVLQKETNL